MSRNASRKSRKKSKSKNRRFRRTVPRCGLCGATQNLTRTECCNNWICDDADQYVMFSYERNSCYRNHQRYTLCGYHWANDHSGDWKTCPQCREDFSHELEMYVDSGTNEYNFETLPNPPKFEPTHCTGCGQRIVLSEGGYSYGKDGYRCMDCMGEDVPAFMKGDSAKREIEPNHSPQETHAKPRSIIPFPGVASDASKDEDIDLNACMDKALEYLTHEVPPHWRERFHGIVELTDDFCDAHLNDEYKLLCRDMAASCCQDGSPAVKGKCKSWAAGIVYSLGWVNFLTDPAQEPYMKSPDIAAGLGVSTATMQAKSKVIRKGLDLFHLDPEWTLPGRAADNPLTWMFETDNGLIVDIRDAPREVQAEAYEAGLIPYIPADRDETSP